MLIDQPALHRPITPAPDFVAPSFAAVYAKTLPVVRRSARGLGIPRSALDDVVQDVFLTVHRRLPHFAGRCSVENWVFGILLRVVRNHRRTRRRKGAGHALSSTVGNPDELVGHDDPSDTVSLLEAKTILQAMLSKLKQRHASLWVMAKVDGLSPAEIAKKKGISVFTVYSRLRAAQHGLDRELSRSRCAEGARVPRRPAPILGKIGSRASAAA
ncbi:MAG TPA: RNA polymerase sigma factor [Polyangiaceae bacterium]|nr:RNA polymerase sigma factor [Polyangiaceae bacterium]